MTNKEIYEKLLNKDLGGFIITKDSDGKLCATIKDLFSDVFEIGFKERIIEQAQNFNKEEFVKNNNTMSTIFEEMGIMDVLSDMDFDLILEYNNRLDKYVEQNITHLTDQQYHEFINCDEAPSTKVQDNLINEIILEIPEVKEVIDEVENLLELKNKANDINSPIRH